MMKSFFKKLAFVMALAMVVSAAAPAAKSAAAATEFTYAYQNAGAVEELYMKAGDEVDLCFKGVRDYKEYTLQWKSGNPLVATVDKNGIVKAVENGTTTIELVVGDGSVYTSTPVKVVVGEEIKVALGTSADDTFTAKTLEVGTSVDLGFYGVPNYSETNYSYTWISNAPEVVKVDQKGVCVAVASGSATVTVAIVNNVTGDTLDVTPVVFTVPTPVVELTYEVKQNSHIEAQLTFNDTVNFTKNDVTLERVYDGGFTTVWPIKNFEVKDNVIKFEPYVAFADGDKYLIKVGADDEGTEFTTTLGQVTDVVLSYKTADFGDMGKGKAYTNGEDGVELTVQISAELYSNGVKVTKAPGYSTEDIVYTLSAENEYAMIDEYAGTIVFSKAGVPVTVIANYVYYDKDDNEQKVPGVIEMTSEMAPTYTVTGVKAWTIATAGQLSGEDKIDWSKPVHAVPAYDKGFGIVALITDNYGNTTSTVAGLKHSDDKIVNFAGSRLESEGFYVNYSSANVEKLLVGPEGDLTTYVSTSVPVIFELMGPVDGETKLIRNIYAGTVTVKDARKLDKITIDKSSLTLVTDGKYTEDKVTIKAYDQYGGDWKDSVALNVACNVANTTNNNVGDWTMTDGKIEFTFDGSEIECDKSSFTLTFKANNSKTTSLKVSLKDLKYNDDKTIKTTSYQLSSTGANQTVDKQENYDKTGYVAAKVNYYTLSNGYKYDTVSTVNGKDLVLVTDANQLKLTTAQTTKGQQFIVVYNPDGNIVGAANDENALGVKGTDGAYEIVVADDVANKMTYAKTGTYTVKVLQVSSFNKKDEAVFSTKYSAAFKVENNNAAVSLKKQDKLETEETAIADIIEDTLIFNLGGSEWKKFHAGMVDVTETLKKVVENEESNYIVITDVVINVPLNGDNDSVYYTVTVPVNKAVKVPANYNWK